MLCFIAGAAAGLFAAGLIALFRDDSLPARIVIVSDNGRNPRFRWLLQTCRGNTVANCVGSFAEECEAKEAARVARRMMRGSRVEIQARGIKTVQYD